MFIFLLYLTVIHFFLGALRAISVFMQDPFGTDAVDIPITTIGMGLFRDLDLLTLNAEAAAEEEAEAEAAAVEGEDKDAHTTKAGDEGGTPQLPSQHAAKGTAKEERWEREESDENQEARVNPPKTTTPPLTLRGWCAGHECVPGAEVI